MKKEETTHPASGDHDDARLRWQLRGMRQDLPAQRDLWPQIAARITSPRMTSPRMTSSCTTSSPAGPARAGSTVARPQRRPRALRWAPLALAASLLIAVGMAWQLRPLPRGMTPVPVQSTQSPARLASARLLPREADAMAREYAAALHELQAATPQQIHPHAETAALQELDRSAGQIRDALRRDPGARFLFERLRRTYAQRLALTRRDSFT